VETKVTATGKLAAAIEHYETVGFGVLRGVFAADEMAELAAAFDRQWRIGMAEPESRRQGRLYYRIGEDAALGRILRLVQWPSCIDPVFERLRTDARIFALLRSLLGPDIKQIINQLHWKPPGAAAAEFAFHQDIRFRRPREAYRNLPQSYVQTGIAVDPHSAANGAMLFYPASHRLGEIDLAISGAVMDQAASGESLKRARLDPARLVVLELEPGDLAFWDLLAVHGSGRNLSDRDRRFYLNGYVRAADCDEGEWAYRDGRPCPLAPGTLPQGDPFLRMETEISEAE
jgi:ectoine hydroxylase-related dioxygenase (phytanoyl-CoA dioxygenase family)